MPAAAKALFILVLLLTSRGTYACDISSGDIKAFWSCSDQKNLTDATNDQRREEASELAINSWRLNVPSLWLGLGLEYNKVRDELVGSTGYKELNGVGGGVGLVGNLVSLGTDYSLKAWQITNGKFSILGREANFYEGMTEAQIKTHLWRGFGSRAGRIVFGEYLVNRNDTELNYKVVRERSFKQILKLFLAALDIQQRSDYVKKLAEEYESRSKTYQNLIKIGKASGLDLLITREKHLLYSAQANLLAARKVLIESEICETMGVRARDCTVPSLKAVDEKIFSVSSDLEPAQSAVYQMSLSQVQQQELSVWRAEEALRPELDLSISARALSERGNQFPSFLATAGEEWQIRLDLTLPLDRNLSDIRAQSARSQLSLKQRQAQVRLDEERLRMRSLRLAENNLRLAIEERIKARTLAIEKVEAAKKSLQIGLISAKDLTDFELELAEKTFELSALKNELVETLFDRAMYHPEKNRVLLLD
jgi:hypothetical protein